MTTAILAWAIKAPDGHIIINTVTGSMGESWSNKCFPWAVKSLEEQGYRCVRVLVVEQESKPAKAAAANSSSKE